MFLISICVILCTANNVLSAEINHQADNFAADSEETKDASLKVLKKDSRIVPIPIPIANPTIGTGLAGALLYIHPSKSNEPDAPTSTTGIALQRISLLPFFTSCFAFSRSAICSVTIL